tara:strand:- start:40 stop:348 length:309 start_codon:yes stop_codon:yes gene_type:complete
MSNVARSSGLITVDTLVHTGRCKLVSIHACNLHATDISVITVHDNTAASGKVVGKMVLPALADGGGAGTALSLEFDMHGVVCRKGLYVDVNAGTPNVTVEFA